MRTYISLSGFDTSQILSLIVKYGIGADDKIILIRPEDETDTRGEATIHAVQDLSRQINSSIKVEIHRVDHRDFEEMVLSLTNLIKNAEGEIIANISGGPREIFLAFTIACLAQSQKLYKTTNYSDIDRSMCEINLPRLVKGLDEKSKRVLKDVLINEPATITKIAQRLEVSESTISRQVAKMADLGMLDVNVKGKSKYVRMTLTSRLFLLIDRA